MKFLIYLLIFFSVTGCTYKNNVPRGIIAKDQMGKILWDMILADQYSLQYLVKDSAKMNVKSETMKLYQQVFQIHHISQNEFQKSFQYYLSRPDLSKIMFDSIAAMAARQREQLYRPAPKAADR